MISPASRRLYRHSISNQKVVQSDPFVGFPRGRWSGNASTVTSWRLCQVGKLAAGTLNINSALEQCETSPPFSTSPWELRAA